MISFAFALLAIQPLLAICTPFDGQYINPTPNDRGVEWWWGSAVARKPAANGIPPVVQFLFNDGIAFVFGDRNVSAPQYTLDVKGFDNAGKPIDLSIPATSGSVTSTTSRPEAVTGVWAPIAKFQLSQDFKTFTVTFTAPQLTGTIVMKSSGQHNFACGNLPTPYLDSAVNPSATLTDSETTLFHDLGWARSIQSGSATVDLVLNGIPLKFSGDAYHDQNWAHKTLNDFVKSWYFGFAQVGHYAFNYASASPVEGTHSLNTGFLLRNGAILQNQCSTIGAKSSDISSIVPSGEVDDAGIIVPSSFNLSYVLASKEVVRFTLTPLAQNPDRSVYHRWIGTVKGGIVGNSSDQVSGFATFEWLNPAILTHYPQLH